MKKRVETIETLLEIMKKTLDSGEDVLISEFGGCSGVRKTLLALLLSTSVHAV